MLCERVLGSVPDDAPDVDWIPIDWRLTRRRALRLVSTGGRRVNVLLPRGQSLQHGDVVAIVDQTRVAVSVNVVPVLIVSPNGVEQAIRIAGELGNLHVPIQVSGDRLIVPDDGPVRELLDAHATGYRTERMRFAPDVLDRSTIGDAR